jgi:hypothetical protein
MTKGRLTISGWRWARQDPHPSSALFRATAQRNHKERLDGDEYDRRGPAPSKP